VDINATLIGQMITFAIFVWFTMKYVWPVLEKTLKERQDKIALGLMAAERGHKELDIAQKDAIKHIREARERAMHVIEQANKQAALIIENAKQIANQEREQIIASGKIEVTQQRAVAKEQLQGEVADLVVATTEKLLGRIINAEDQKILLDLQKAGWNG
jgi:F-type H+-transporting ATPase subunit b